MMTDETTTSVPDADASDLDLNTLKGLQAFKERRWRLATEMMLNADLYELFDLTAERTRVIVSRVVCPMNATETVVITRDLDMNTVTVVIAPTTGHAGRERLVYSTHLDRQIYVPGPWVTTIRERIERDREHVALAEQEKEQAEIARLRAEMGLDQAELR